MHVLSCRPTRAGHFAGLYVRVHWGAIERRFTTQHLPDTVRSLLLVGKIYDRSIDLLTLLPSFFFLFLFQALFLFVFLVLFLFLLFFFFFFFSVTRGRAEELLIVTFPFLSSDPPALTRSLMVEEQKVCASRSTAGTLSSNL